MPGFDALLLELERLRPLLRVGDEVHRAHRVETDHGARLRAAEQFTSSLAAAESSPGAYTLRSRVTVARRFPPVINCLEPLTVGPANLDAASTASGFAYCTTSEPGPSPTRPRSGTRPWNPPPVDADIAVIAGLSVGLSCCVTRKWRLADASNASPSPNSTAGAAGPADGRPSPAAAARRPRLLRPDHRRARGVHDLREVSLTVAPVTPRP